MLRSFQGPRRSLRMPKQTKGRFCVWRAEQKRRRGFHLFAVASRRFSGASAAPETPRHGRLPLHPDPETGERGYRREPVRVKESARIVSSLSQVFI